MNARDANTVTRPGLPDHVDAGPVVGGRHRPTDPWLRMDGHGASGVPAAGQPGHGRTASLPGGADAARAGAIEFHV